MGEKEKQAEQKKIREKGAGEKKRKLKNEQ